MTIGRIAFIGWFFASPAFGEFPRDWYVSAGVGWDYASSVKLDSNDAKVDFDRGIWLPSGAFGSKFGDAWRVELDASIRENTPEIVFSSSAGIEVDSDPQDLIKASSLLINVLREVPMGLAWRPYLGAGVGVAKVEYHLSELAIDTRARQRPRRDIINDETTTWAYQLIAGFTVPLTRRFDLSADYRYWQAPSLELNDATGADLDIEHGVHSAWLHLRYHAPDAGVLPMPAPRQKPGRGFYLSSSIGGGFSEDADIKGTINTLDAFDLGPTATLALGYSWRKRWRFELEGSYRRNAIEVVDFGSQRGEDAASGEVRSYGLMVNGFFQFAPGSSIRPFIGGGVGIVHASYDAETFGFCEFFVCGPAFGAEFIDDKDSAQAYQAIVGVDVAISPQLTFTADYRYWVTSDFKMRAPDGESFATSQENTSIVVGVRYSFAGAR